MSSSPLLERLNALIERGERMRSFRFPEKDGVLYQMGASNRARLMEWKDSCLDLIRAAAGEESELYRAFPVDYSDHGQETFYAAMDHYICILRILRERMEEPPDEEPPMGDVSPFIVDGARRLLEAGYKDAAAIYCRVILGVSMRALCRGNGVEFESGDSINRMAQRLMDAAVLSPEDWRAIQMWATFANTAAHQNFSQYKADQVREMVGWLQEFAARTAQAKPVVTTDDI